MLDASEIKEILRRQNMSVNEKEIPLIHQVLSTIYKEQVNMNAFPDIHETVPLTIVDQEMIT
ncbi:hypothetical protein [Bacillus alkalicellulosilyticus]|uniref:hypothetical protein n=1 Tax=Alkalihalobacterium alkalicellulosilyticum TaxID=1912214 RepID=UPI0009967A76|nr:hypothetical protein [Bacillus alkalicellulosilyticus]